jgi:hypothetical protein
MHLRQVSRQNLSTHSSLLFVCFLWRLETLPRQPPAPYSSFFYFVRVCSRDVTTIPGHLQDVQLSTSFFFPTRPYVDVDKLPVTVAGNSTKPLSCPLRAEDLWMIRGRFFSQSDK